MPDLAAWRPQPWSGTLRYGRETDALVWSF